jgi:hypothetical protein
MDLTLRRKLSKNKIKGRKLRNMSFEGVGEDIVSRTMLRSVGGGEFHHSLGECGYNWKWWMTWGKRPPAADKTHEFMGILFPL